MAGKKRRWTQAYSSTQVSFTGWFLACRVDQSRVRVEFHPEEFDLQRYVIWCGNSPVAFPIPDGAPIIPVGIRFDPVVFDYEIHGNIVQGEFWLLSDISGQTISWRETYEGD